LELRSLEMQERLIVVMTNGRVYAVESDEDASSLAVRFRAGTQARTYDARVFERPGRSMDDRVLDRYATIVSAHVVTFWIQSVTQAQWPTA
jgi:hypothetical protein